MPGPEPTIINLTWDTTNLTMPVGGTASTTVSNSITNYMQYLTSSDIDALTSSVATSSVDGTTYTVTFTGVAAGTVTIPANTTIQSPQSVVSTNALTITVVDATPKYLDKDGLDYYDSLIATEIDGKQDTLTAGTGISISNNVISATGGGVADSVAWGHITGTMSDQTDLTTALGAKANSADLATVATSGDYDDLTDKPTIGNATLTIQKNGTSAGTFTANATSNKTINITVPTTAADVSALPASTKYGASIAVSINTTDYKVTTTLKDQDGNTLGTAQVIDLPLESVVVNGSYDSTNKKIVLTLQNGNTIDIPVGDLVAGLQSEITSTNKLASDLVDDTNQTHKFMTSAEKTKLSGIAAGAEVNVQSDWDQTTTTADDYIKNKPSLATVATSGSYNDLSNKPTIPTVNNATLTIQRNGTNVQTFTANQSTNATANIVVPTKTSDLTNDSGFLDSVAWGDVTGKPTFATVATSGSYNDLSNKPTIPAAQVQSDWNQTTTTAVDYIKNKPTKVSDFTNDAGYITSYTDTQVTQTRIDPSSITTFYPVASTSSTTNTGDVKKFSAVKINYINDDGGRAELELGQNSYYDPVYGELTLWDVGPSSQHKTTLRRALDATNQTFYFPYNADSTGGTLVANGSLTAGTGSATNPVYADSEGILHATTYALNATVPSNAVFTDTTYSDATTSASGLMSASDKTKLNGIASGAEVNVQANWTQTTTTADDYIKNKPTLATVATSGSYNDLSNKPTIPTVNNATLTIQKNGTNVQTFTANQSTNATANITVPTKTSELTNDSSFVTSSGTVAKADQLTTGRTIALSGGAIGTATSFNGTANISIPVTKMYETYLDWGNQKLSGRVSPVDAGMSEEFSANRLAYMDASKITVEYSRDGGSTWTDYGLTAAQKTGLVTTSQAIYTGGTSSNAAGNYQVRVNLNPTNPYMSTRKLFIYVSTNGVSNAQVLIEKKAMGGSAYETVTTATVSGWSGWNSIPITITFGGSSSWSNSDLRLTFSYNGKSESYPNAQLMISKIRLYGETAWSAPSNLATNGHIYSYDTAQNATFPANVNVTGSLGHGNYTYTLPNKNGTVAMTSDLPAAQVNSDWNASSGVAQILNKPTLATVATSGSYNDLTNKPTIPTVNNATLTIQKNGSTVKTFTANASSNVTANITVPTKTSDLTNDSNFVASTALATVATSGSYNDLSNKPTIPTVNNATLTIQKNGTNVQTFTANASSNKTANIIVPTKTSDITNDSGFIIAEDIASTSALTPPVQTSMIADKAVTAAKIDFSTMNAITASCGTSGADTTIAANAIIQATAVYAQTGTGFSVSGGYIVVGAGISKVFVSASVFYAPRSGGPNYGWFQLEKNNTEVSGTRAITNLYGSSFGTATLAEKIIDVTEGDKISIRNLDNGTYRQLHSYITVRQAA